MIIKINDVNARYHCNLIGIKLHLRFWNTKFNSKVIPIHILIEISVEKIAIKLRI